MLFTILIFDFPKFLLLIFFGKIWSHNLEYFKLIEIWLRGRLLYAYFDFNIFFSTFFSFIFFGTIRPKIWSSSNWQKLAKIYEQQILWKVKHQNHYQHIKMCPCIKFQLVWRALDFGTKFPKNYVNGKILNHIPIYPCTKFQSIWRTSNSGTKFTQEMTEKDFKNKN